MAREKSRSTDQAGTGPDPRLSRHLMPLREAKRFRLAKGEADIRGWSVFTSSGQEVGRVGDLLVDPAMGEVVMFDVNRGDTGDQTIAPLRAAWIDRETKRVIIDASLLAPQSDAYATGLYFVDMDRLVAEAVGEPAHERPVGDEVGGAESELAQGASSGDGVSVVVSRFLRTVHHDRTSKVCCL